MRTIVMVLVVLASTALGSCEQQQDNKELQRMVEEACEDLHAAWNRGHREAMNDVLPQLRERAAAQGYGPEETDAAFQQHCTMPG